LNEILVGPRTQQDALDELFESGVQKPAKQAENPLVQMVLSASPSYFRDNGQGPGQWNQDKLDDWLKASMKYLEDNFGDDVIHVALHLDEDTPHVHVLIAPTYEKKPRVPGKKKRNETDAEFEARKETAKNSDGVRTVGRASNEFWKQNYCRRIARQKYHKAVEHLGLGYGKDFVEEGLPSPESKTTGQWVREQAAELNNKAKDLEAEAQALETRKSESTNELSSLASQKQDLAAQVDEQQRDLYDVEIDALQLEHRIEGLRETLAEVETAAHDAERRRDAADADLAIVEVLRPALQAAQALAAIEDADETTRAELFETLTPAPDLGPRQWATAIRMTDPFFAPDVAPHIPRSPKPRENYDTLSEFNAAGDKSATSLMGEMLSEKDGLDAEHAVTAVQRRELTVADLDEPADTPAKSWLSRAADGLKRGIAFATAAVSETTQALAGVFNSLPSETQSALSRLFRSRDGAPKPMSEPETTSSPFDPGPGP